LKEAQLAKQAAGEHDKRQEDKRAAYKKKKIIEGEKLGDAGVLEGHKGAQDAMKKYWDKKAADEAAEKAILKAGRRETKSIMAKPKEVKKEKSWWGKMPDKDKAGIIMGAGKGLLSARQKYLEAKQKRKEAIAKGESEAAKTRAAAGRQLIAAPVSLRKGGRVSFKDVLKAKKKMGY